MISNYFFAKKNAFHPSFLNIASSVNAFNYFRLFITLLFGFASLFGSAQVAITRPNLSITACSFPSAYNNLGNIVITETADTNFSPGLNRTLILTAPTNFEFLSASGSVTFAPMANLSAASVTVAATTITVTYTCGNTNKIDVMTISNIQVRAINLASTGNITRTSGNGIINGLVTNTPLTNTLTSVSTPYPQISTQPSASSVCSNGTASLSVVALNATLYQWRRAGVPLANVAPYSNVTTAILTITNPSAGIAGNFDVVINNGSLCSTISNSVFLTVNVPPVVSSPSAVCVGNSIQLFPSTGGTWVTNNPSIAIVDNTGLVNGLAPGSATFTYTNTATTCSSTTSSITVNALPVVSAPASVCVTNTIQLLPSLGGTWTSSNPSLASVNNSGLVTGIASGTVIFTFTNTTTNCIKTTNQLTVYALPLVSTPTAICVGSTAQLSPTTGGTWLSNNPTVASVDNTGLVTGLLSGSATFTFTDSNSNCSKTTTSLLVNGLPSLFGPSSVCLGNTIQLSPTTGGTWSSNSPANASVDNTGLVTGLSVGSASFTFTNSTTTCSNTTSSVTVNGFPVVSAPISVCVGNTVQLSPASGGTWASSNPAVASVNNSGLVNGISSGNVTFIYTNTTTGCSNTTNNMVIYALPIVSSPTNVCVGNTVQLSSSSSGTWISNNPSIASIDNSGLVTGLTSGNATFTFTDSTTNCNATSTTTVNINSPPTINGHPASTQTVCTGNLVSFTVSATGGALSYQWYRGMTSLNNGGIVSGANSSTLTLNPVTQADAASDYYCIVNNVCASGANSNNAELIISPKAVIPAQAINTCDGVAFSLAPTDGVPTASTIVPVNTVYSWSVPTITGGLTGGTAQNNQLTINGTLFNPTNIDQTATYIVTPKSGTSVSCTGASFAVTVTVKPSPFLSYISSSICSASTLTLLPVHGGGNIIPSGTLYSWPTPLVTGGISGGSSGNSVSSIVQTLTNPTNGPQTATYTITASTGSCNGNTFILTVTVKPTPVASVNIASQTVCSAVSNTPILVSNAVNATTTYTWSRDNAINVTGASTGTSGNISGGSTFSITNNLINATGVSQNVIYTITPTTNGCPGVAISSTVVVVPSSAGGAVTVSLPNVLPTVNSITVCHFASGNLYLTGQTGNVVRWESTVNGGSIWTAIGNTSATYSYVNVTQTTIYRAVIQNGTTCPLAYSTASMVNVIPNIKPTPVTASPPIICVGDSSLLFSQSGFATNQYIANGGTFSNSNPVNWLVDGCGNCLSAGGSNTNAGPFQLSATNGGTYSGINYTSIGKFAIANGNFNSIMQTPIFNTFGLTTLNLSFTHAFNLLTGAWANVELSLDGGTTYNIVLAQYNGPLTRTPYAAFPNTTIDMSNYIGQTNLRIRFNYHGTVGSSWAIDNILLPEAPPNLAVQWVDALSGIVISNSATVTVTPIVTTTYAVTSFLNGCASYGPDGTTYVTITVNQRPTAYIEPSQTICNGGTATFRVSLTGVAPWSITYSNGITSNTINNINTNPYVFSVSNITANSVYTITGLSDSKCTSKPTDLTGAPRVTVLNGTPGLWTGLFSTDWFDCRNWAGGLPSNTVNAVIPAGTSRMPIIDPANSSFALVYSNTASAQDLIIEATATVRMTSLSTSQLQISRDWKNSGTFTPGIGTVTFNGSTTSQVQNINVGINTTETFYNVIINNSNGALGVSVVDGFQLTVLNHITLISGDLRLTGEAQLVQSGLTANPLTGTGKLLKDQQGNKSSFNYNYWSSPVTTTNSTYTVAGVLRDGTNVSTNPFAPTAIQFGDGVSFSDGPATSPIKISNRWIFKYTTISSSYFSWQAVGSTGTINIGEGFTMKGVDGTAGLTDTQNYVFAGKPNNGTIILNLALTQSYLVGNPYPSALNADTFIKDNIKDGGNATSNVFNGALYFWDHFGGQTHYLAQYVGGYATYTLMGGVVAIANDPLNINDGSAGTKVPVKYIAVGQGFFVKTELDSNVASNLITPITGGSIVFKNSQRAFKTESSANSVFFRTQNTTVSVAEEDERPKIRLKFDSPSGLHRQILLGADSNTTNLFDIGYDAPIIDINSDDMYWQSGNGKFVIQAIPDFNAEQIIPLGIVTAHEGLCKIKIETLENIPDFMPIYLHDSESGIYHDMRNSDFTISLPIGSYHNRFSLRFSNVVLGVTDSSLNDGLALTFTNGNNILTIHNNFIETELQTITLLNMLGQSIQKWAIENQHQENTEIALPNVSFGTYIVKLKTNKGEISKKIIIK